MMGSGSVRVGWTEGEGECCARRRLRGCSAGEREARRVSTGRRRHRTFL